MPFINLEQLSATPTAFSGPYKLEGSSTDDKFDLVKWRSDSLESKSPPQKIHFFGTTEDPIALAKAGKTDTLDRDHVGANDQNELESRGWGISPTELTGETFIILNPKFLSEELRRYLYLKIDPAQIVVKIKEGQFKASYGLIPTGFPGELSLSDVEPLRKEVPQYKGKKVSFKFDFDPGSEMEKQIAEYIKAAWSNDHIEVQLNPMSKGDKLQRMFEKKSEAVLGRKGIDYPDGFSVLTYFKGKYESNYYFVDKPEIDASIAEAVKEFDSSKRATLYKKIQLQILREHTLLPILFGSQASGMWSGKVQRAPSHPMGYHTMPFETIEMRTE
ncbi:MAG TPA: ABC transporter substrate-binding protein [Pseudobdellovibrionaceae bacterium]|jgi:ABC-type transport system substrate-binding protein